MKLMTTLSALIDKRRQQNQKFPSFQMFRFAARGVGGAANKNDRKFLGFAPRELVERGRGAKGWRWHALRAYDWVSSHHALRACEVSPFPDSAQNGFGFHRTEGANKKTINCMIDSFLL